MFKSIFSHFRTLLLSTIFLSLSATLPLNGAPLPAQKVATDFSEVAKKAIPSVVFINVKAKLKQQDNSLNLWGSSGKNSGFDFFGDDFFKQFFGQQQQEPDRNPDELITIGQASGFIVSADGYILTNSHVVKDAEELSVLLNDHEEYPAKLIGHDPSTDIALIKIDAKDLPFLTLANSSDILIGEWAIAIGNPFGLQATLTVGVISATGRNNLDIVRVEDFIQTDAAINEGNSGGPLLNIEGQVIGMNTAIVSNNIASGIGFAIPSNMLKRVMDELIHSGKISRGFLGVVLQEIDAKLAKALHLSKPEGALVVETTPKSPAEKAGLKSGDVIISYNDTPVTNTAALRSAVAMMKPGTKITLKILREDKPITLTLEVGTFPTDEKIATTKESQESKESKYGITVQTLTPELAESMGYKNDKGVVVIQVASKSPAAWAGIKKGTLIVSVNRHPVTSAAEFNKAVEATPAGNPLLLLIKTGGGMRFVTLFVNQ